MKVVQDISQFSPEKKVVLTQGTFDGVHFGHQKILTHVVSEAKKIDGISVLLTFHPHPRLVLYPEDNELKLLTTIEEKTEKVAKLGVDYLILLPFTKELSRVGADMFVRNVLVEQLQVHKLIIGYDHRFGRNREGGIEEMYQYAETYNFLLEEIPAQDIEQSIVSSTKIRKSLLQGDVKTAKEYLGKGYTISGEVEQGHQRGAKIGFPTANIGVNSRYKLIPINGVYAVWVYLANKKYPAMLNIGFNPTFEDKNWSVEVHIFDFNENIYGKEIALEFVTKIRDETKFENTEELINQLGEDEKEIRDLLENNSSTTS